MPSQFPSIERDISILVSKDFSYKEISKLIYASGGNLLKDVSLFDLYIDSSIDDNKHRSPASPLGLLCERDNQKINFRRKLLSGKMSSDEIDNQLEQNKRDRQKKLRKYIDMNFQEAE